MKKIYLSAVFFIALSAGAQNLNPTVSVTRDYEGKLMEVHKPSMAMFVPDSLHRFDLDFDYSVFANPYGISAQTNAGLRVGAAAENAEIQDGRLCVASFVYR